MHPDDFAAIVEGYQNRTYRISSELRMSTFISILPHTKNLNYTQFCRDVWPLQGDEIPERVTYEQPTIEEFNAILKAHKIKAFKPKTK